MYKYSLALSRLALGLALIGSVTWQVTDRIANDLFRPAEYFAYFSIVTAIVAGLFLITTGFGLLLNIEDTKWVEVARLSLAVALIVVGVVYHALLAGAANDVRDGDYAWPVLPNEIIHTYAPILAVIEYLISVKAFRIRLRAFVWVAVFPLTWLVLSIVRGMATNWWPYWFINPNGEAGLGGMLTYISAITVFFLVLGLAVLGLKQVLRRLLAR
ncbi:MAG: Pr6Pr family membrane protein [Micrococcales bacterium]|nr:Pr6Pr family membrane protein [Micrococcales bacterium]